MKKNLLLLIILITVFSGCLQEKNSKNGDNEIKGSIAGKVKYENFCSICHGLNGNAQEKVTKSLKVQPSSLITEQVRSRSDIELYDSISKGVNQTTMLSWGDILSEEEIHDMVGYIRILQNRA